MGAANFRVLRNNTTSTVDEAENNHSKEFYTHESNVIVTDDANNTSNTDVAIPKQNAFYSTEEEVARKRKLYAHITSAVNAQEKNSHERWGKMKRSSSSSEHSNSANEHSMNVIEQVYNEDFNTIDHTQAIRFPQAVVKQIKDAIRGEAERRCAEMEKAMARCMQDKMWTTWKCQKHRDAYYYCVRDEEMKNNTSHFDDDNDFVDLMTAYRWKYNLGVFHGEIIGRNNLMRKIWNDHYPDRELPHPWVKDEYK